MPQTEYMMFSNICFLLKFFFWEWYHCPLGFRWYSGKESACHCRRCKRHRFNPWVGKVLSVQFNHSVMPSSLRPHEPQHARPPCPSPTPRVYPNPCPLSWWCHPAISSSVIPFSSCPQSLQHQSLFQWVNSSHQVARVLEFQLQYQSFQWTPRTDLL